MNRGPSFSDAFKPNYASTLNAASHPLCIITSPLVSNLLRNDYRKHDYPILGKETNSFIFQRDIYKILKRFFRIYFPAKIQAKHACKSLPELSLSLLHRRAHFFQFGTIGRNRSGRSRSPKLKRTWPRPRGSRTSTEKRKKRKKKKKKRERKKGGSRFRT